MANRQEEKGTVQVQPKKEKMAIDIHTNIWKEDIQTKNISEIIQDLIVLHQEVIEINLMTETHMKIITETRNDIDFLLHKEGGQGHGTDITILEIQKTKEQSQGQIQGTGVILDIRIQKTKEQGQGQIQGRGMILDIQIQKKEGQKDQGQEKKMLKGIMGVQDQTTNMEVIMMIGTGSIQVISIGDEVDPDPDYNTRIER